MRTFALTALIGVLVLSCGPAPNPAPTAEDASSSSGSGRNAVYAAVGPEIVHYSLDPATASLTRKDTVSVPENVQYAWPHPSRRYLYVAWSDGVQGTKHGLSAFRVDPESGSLSPYGRAVPLRARPIHVSVDIPGENLLVAYNNPPGISIYQIAPDGTIGAERTTSAELDTGIYPHQIRADPSNSTVLLIARGNDPTAEKPEELGAIKVFGYDGARLTNRQSIVAESRKNFQPRHLDFHPSRPWIFLALERQNTLQVYERLESGLLRETPLFSKSALAKPETAPESQRSAAIHVHPNGRFVYMSNRAATERGIPPGGENSIAVFSINQKTGEPTLIQNADTRGAQPRTFALNPEGTILIAANQIAFLAGGEVVPASLAVFRVGNDGKLQFVQKYDVPTEGSSRTLMWVGGLALP